MRTHTHYSSSFLELYLIPFSAAYSANDFVAKPCIVSLIACVSASVQISCSKQPTTAPATIRSSATTTANTKRKAHRPPLNSLIAFIYFLGSSAFASLIGACSILMVCAGAVCDAAEINFSRSPFEIAPGAGFPAFFLSFAV